MITRGILIMLCVLSTACGSAGEPLLLAQWFDAQDPCQTVPVPDFCHVTLTDRGVITRTQSDNSARTYRYTP
jgi:hypothetical protein